MIALCPDTRAGRARAAGACPRTARPRRPAPRILALLAFLIPLAIAPTARASTAASATATTLLGAPSVWAFLPAIAAADSAPADSGGSELIFTPSNGDSLGTGEEPIHVREIHIDAEVPWIRPPFGDDLITDPDVWRWHGDRGTMIADYNRVDRLRLGFRYETQTNERMNPRFGARVEFPFDRQVWLYGVQLEQPLFPPGRLVLGVSMIRKTDHSELQQMDDLENSLALLFFRQDFRDYFEREGYGAYLALRIPDFSTISVHVRNDDYRSLPTNWGTRSWFNTDVPLRENPAIDDGTVQSLRVRLERLARPSHRNRGGHYHWIEYERAGHQLNGDFQYQRFLADVRNVLRLSPAATFAVRGVMGSGWDGAVPLQRQFTLGGVDGLRAHPFAQYQGRQIALMQAEYTLGLYALRTGHMEGGLQALAFIDAGHAWNSSDGTWDVGRQRLETDGGFGIATSNDNLRLYFAKDLQHPESKMVMTLRLQQPF